jgi:ABC-type lipoprotein export system ATPase subunit
MVVPARDCGRCPTQVCLRKKINKRLSFPMIDIEKWTRSLVSCPVDKIIIKGKSGIGKSTLLRSLKLYYGNKSILVDDKSLIFDGTIEENILVGRTLRGGINKYLELLFEDDARLKDKNTRISISGLSSGQIQRISLLRDLILSQDKTVMLDEPTSALDAAAEERFSYLLSTHSKDLGFMKLIISTHSNQLEKQLKGAEVVYLSD